MTINSDGFESEVWVGGQPYIEMQARVWYQLPNQALIENQHPRPILVSSVLPPMVTPPVTWPSPHFRESITALTILAGEKQTVKAGAYIMSTHFRLQPIDEDCMLMGQIDGTCLADANPNPPVCVDLEETYLCDSNDGIEVIKHTCLMSDGTVQFKYYKEGIEVTQSPSFTAKVAQLDVERETRFATNVLASDAQYGRVVEVEMRKVYRDGALAPADITFWDEISTPPVDVTAIVTVAPYQLASAPIRVKLPTELLAVTGTAGVALAAIPATSTYAEIYIDVGAVDSGVRWTIDGTAPADNNGEQENMGATIHLYDRDQIVGFRAVPIDGDGAVAGALTANLTVSYWNVDPQDD